ncbi:MAG: glycoside hydrolase family 20 zincin-like fold domain-containing protein [Planctomycetota bacterium]|jgi:hypothetical protein
MNILKSSMKLIIAITCLCSSLSALEITPASFSKEKTKAPFEITAKEIETEIVIDGKLDDKAWGSASRTGAFWKSGVIDVAEEQTLAWVAYDPQNIYIAFACIDKKITGLGGEFPRDDKAIWQHDCVEVFLAPERDSENERQFILSSNNGKYDRWNKNGKTKWNPSPDWDGKVSQTPWGYTAEIKIPLAALVDTEKYPVKRGLAWGLKLTREDFGGHKGARVSSWTILGQTTHDTNAMGRLYFEDKNIYADGTFDVGIATEWSAHLVDQKLDFMVEDGAGVNKSKAVKLELSGDGYKGLYTINIDSIDRFLQPVEATYYFSADMRVDKSEVKKGGFRVRIKGGSQIASIKLTPDNKWHKVGAYITVNKDDHLEVPQFHGRLDGKAVIYLDNISLVMADRSEILGDSDARCLTGNARGVLAKYNERINGTYTYTRPETTDPFFPFYFPEGIGPKEDYGRYRGNVPFDKGKLTDSFPATEILYAQFWKGAEGFSITFDLGAEYKISRIVLHSSSAGKNPNEVLYLKSENEKRFTRVASLLDLYSFNEKKVRKDSQKAEFKNINQAARWLRIKERGKTLGEIEIWGRKLKKGEKIKRIAYKQNGGKVLVKNPKSEPIVYKGICPVFPKPQEIKMTGSNMAVNNDTLICYEPVDSKRALITAEVLRDEIKACYGIELKVQPAGKRKTNILLVGLAEKSPLTSSLLKSSGKTVTAKDPGKEGYFLVADRDKVVIGGSDDRGAFYGVQSLLSLVVKKSESWSVRGTEIRDWPDSKYRIIEGRPIATKNLIRALARFKLNYYTPQMRPHLMKAAADLNEYSKRYFLKFIPFIDFNRVVLQKDMNLTERAPDEKLENLGTARRNANPGHPKSWEIFYAACDKWLPDFHGDLVYINYDETYQVTNGSRWNVSKESRALGLSAGQLIAYTMKRIDKKFKEYGKRIMLMDTPFMKKISLSYPGDPDPLWLKGLPNLPKDVLFNNWHRNYTEELFKKHGFEQVELILDDKDWRKDVYPGALQGLSAYMAESAFTPAKLLDLAWVAWNTKAIRPKDPIALNNVVKAIGLWNFIYEGTQSPTLFAGDSDYTAIDLSASANLSRIDEKAGDGIGFVDMGSNFDMRALPSGKIVMADIPFTIIDEKKNNGKSIVKIENRMLVDKSFPSEIEIDMKGIKASSLIFLGALHNRPGWNYLRRKEHAGIYFITYEDGSSSLLDLKYGTNVANWDGLPVNSGYNPRSHNMSKGTLAWEGDTTSGMKAFLYMTEWINPRPDQKIKKIIMRASYSPGNMNPMLFALTAVNHKLGKRDEKAKLYTEEKVKFDIPQGQLLDIRGGTDQSEVKYTAPNGIVVETKNIYNALSDSLNQQSMHDYRSYVGHIALDGEQAARAKTIVFTLPEKQDLTGLMVTPIYRLERKAQDFTETHSDIILEISNDNGKTWQKENIYKDATPEWFGPSWIPFKSKGIKMFRITQNMHKGQRNVNGFSYVEIYKK